MSTDQAAIKAAREAQNRAIARGDLDAIAAFWCEDISLTAGLGFILRGREAYRQAFEVDPTTLYQRLPETIEVSEKPVAFESGSWTGRRRSGSAPVFLEGRYSAMWVKVGNRWLIRSELFVALKSGGPAADWQVTTGQWPPVQ